MVGVFFDSDTYPSPEKWIDKGVDPVAGQRLRKTFRDEAFSKLEKVLRLPPVVGLGEIGIDRTDPANV